MLNYDNIETHAAATWDRDDACHSELYHRRAMARRLQTMLVTNDDGCSAGFWDGRSYIADERERFEAWTYESLYTGLDAVLNGDSKVALRCLVQASKYGARLGGYNGMMADAATTLQNALEALL